jgi:MFS family permease
LGTLVLVVGQGLVSPSVSSGLAAMADPTRRGATFGLNQSTGALARLVGPVVAAWLFDSSGTGAPFVWCLVIAVLAMLATSAVRTPDRTEAKTPVVTHG